MLIFNKYIELKNDIETKCLSYIEKHLENSVALNLHDLYPLLCNYLLELKILKEITDNWDIKIKHDNSILIEFIMFNDPNGKKHYIELNNSTFLKVKRKRKFDNLNLYFI